MPSRSRRRRPNAPYQGPVRAARRVSEEPAPATTARYTPPRRFRYVFRPGWHKVVAVALLVTGISLFFACELSLANIHDFGGHIWYAVGLAVAASSSWWFGLFDPVP